MRSLRLPLVALFTFSLTACGTEDSSGTDDGGASGSGAGAVAGTSSSSGGAGASGGNANGGGGSGAGAGSGATSGSSASGGSLSSSGGSASSSGGTSAGTSGSSSGSGGAAGGATGGGGGGGTSATGGSAGQGGAAGSAGSGGTSSGRTLNVTAAKARYDHGFRTKEADPTVTFNDNTQEAAIDTRAKKMLGKLVLPFQGAGKKNGAIGPAGEFAVRRGFHVLGIAAYQDYTITIDDADFYGDARKQVFDGIEHTKKGEFASIKMTPADGVAQRTQKALAYLQSKFPAEDWGYYLNADGSVRWTDVIFVGMSHGASNSARFGMLVEASRVISLSGPRDNMCTSMSSTNCGGVVAKWFYEKPATPIDRFYAITGEKDEQHLQHLFAMQEMKYVGQNINVEGKKAPFNDSHRLSTNVGHTDFCDESKYFDVCNYVFGVPLENQTPTAP